MLHSGFLKVKSKRLNHLSALVLSMRVLLIILPSEHRKLLVHQNVQARHFCDVVPQSTWMIVPASESQNTDMLRHLYVVLSLSMLLSKHCSR